MADKTTSDVEKLARELIDERLGLVRSLKAADDAHHAALATLEAAATATNTATSDTAKTALEGVREAARAAAEVTATDVDAARTAARQAGWTAAELRRLGLGSTPAISKRITKERAPRGAVSDGNSTDSTRTSFAATADIEETTPAEEAAKSAAATSVVTAPA